MRWNPEGLLLPHDQSRCAPACHLCLDVCPFQNHTDNEDTLAHAQYGLAPGIQRTPETGYYLDAWAGYAGGGFRESGSSGGLASWFLASLLERGLADYVVCVGANPEPERLFSYQVCAHPAEVQAAAKSKYYPVEISDAVTRILQTPGRYAVIGLPCTIKALRLAAASIPRLRERIVFHAGLVCGQTKSRAYTEYLIAKTDGDMTRSKTVEYRGKRADRPATEFSFRILDAQGNVSRTLGWAGAYTEAWSSGIFTPAACCFCDDVFAETADLVFMDAWLPAYTVDARGTSLMLVRSLSTQAVVEAGRSHEQVFLQPIGIEQVIASQAGVLDQKRKQLGHRLALARLKGEVPIKRVPPRQPSYLAAELCRAREALRVQSHRAWNQSDSGIGTFEKNLAASRNRYVRLLRYSRLAQRARTLPRALLNRIRGVLPW